MYNVNTVKKNSSLFGPIFKNDYWSTRCHSFLVKKLLYILKAKIICVVFVKKPIFIQDHGFILKKEGQGKKKINYPSK